MITPQRARLLIVDDNPVNLAVIVGLLRHEHDCVTADCGEAALRLLECGPPPDLALLDVTMPGISGHELCDAMKRHPRWCAIPVVFVTGRTEPGGEAEALRHGAVDFIHKPVVAEALRARVRLHLTLRQQQRVVRESEERMQLASAAAGFGILEYDLRRGTTHWSGQANHLFGLAEGEPPPPLEDVPSLVHPEDLSRARAALRRATDPSGDGVLQVKFRIVPHDGGERWVRCAGGGQFEGEGTDRRAVGVYALLLDVTAEEQSRQRIDFLAFHDTLTGLPNRTLGRERLEEAIATAARRRTGLSVIVADLDGFKDINDTHGHAFGDEVLRRTAERIGACLRGEDTLCRLSGDEFMIVLADAGDIASVAQVLQRVLERVGEPLEIRGVELAVSLCAGAAVHPQDGDSVRTLMGHADTALLEAKKAAPGAWRFFEPQMNADLVHYRQTRDALMLAIERQEFELHYQPRVRLSDGRVLGAEALLRWRRPGQGLVPPNAFIGIAEQTGLIVPIGRWVLHEACRQAMAWRSAWRTDFAVAVNLSAVQFRQGRVEQDVESALTGTGLPAGLLELELTESILFGSDDALQTTVRRWKASGIRLSIDDFGTGYSNLTYLKQLDVDTLKIDRSFVTHLRHDAQDRLIVRAMIQLARGLELGTVAEGVEDAPVASLLREMGCDEAQGYLYARPLPAAEFERWMAGRDAACVETIGSRTERAGGPAASSSAPGAVADRTRNGGFASPALGASIGAPPQAGGPQ